MVEQEEEMALANQLIAKANEILLRNNRTVVLPIAGTSSVIGPSCLPPEVWHFINNQKKFEKSMLWDMYYETLMSRVELFTSDDKYVKGIIISILSDDVAREIKQFLNVKKFDEVTLPNLIKELSLRYKLKTQVWDELRKFKNAQMLPEEKVNDFYGRLIQMAENCEFSEKEKEKEKRKRKRRLAEK